MIIETTINLKNKSKEELILLLNESLGVIEKLQKENEELRKKLNEENKRCMMLAIEKQDYFEKYRYHLQQNESLTKEFSNVIPVQIVKDKIKELNSRIEIYRKYVEQGVETDVEWVGNVAERETVEVLRE